MLSLRDSPYPVAHSQWVEGVETPTNCPETYVLRHRASTYVLVHRIATVEEYSMRGTMESAE